MDLGHMHQHCIHKTAAELLKALKGDEPLMVEGEAQPHIVSYRTRTIGSESTRGDEEVGSTWTKTDEGTIFFCELADSWQPQAVVLHEVELFPNGNVDGYSFKALRHVATDGYIWLGSEDSGFDCEEDDDSDKLKTWLESHALSEPQGLQAVRIRTLEDGTEEIVSGGGNVVHARDGDSHSTVCGQCLAPGVYKEKRWDPWLKQSCPAGTDQTVFLLSFKPISCKRCLKKQEG